MDIGQTGLLEYEYNPLVLKDNPKIDLDHIVTINEIIRRNNLVFVRPFIVLVDGNAVLQTQWDDPIVAGSEVRFIELHGGGGGSNPLRLLALIAIMALSFWLGGWAAAAFGKIVGSMVTGLVGLGGSMLVNYFLGTSMPNEEDDGSEDMATYALDAGNQLAVGVPVPEHFGRCKFFPPLIQTMYTTYVNNGEIVNGLYNHKYDQFLYMIGIIGVGEYTVHNVLIDKTPISHYLNRTGEDPPDVAYNILPPGTDPSLVRRLCWMSAEVNGQELAGDGADDWVRYIVNPHGTRIVWIHLDVMFPGGLALFDKKTGDPMMWNVTITAQVRHVDDNGTAVNDWRTIINHTASAGTTNQIALTLNGAVNPSAYRYEIRIKRNAKNTDTKKRVSENVNITSLKAFGTFHPDYGDCTLIEVKMRASNQLTGNAASKIRIDATRNLYPVTASGFGATKAATTSPVDAAAYIVTADNGGQQHTTNIDWTGLHALRAALVTQGDTFNYRFTSRTNVMEACSRIGRTCRSVPFMPGGKFSMVRDILRSTPVQIYNENDISENSLTITHRMRTVDDPTCVEVQYTDPKTWETKSVQRYDEDGSDENPFVITLDGVTDRDQAWREACYMYADDKLNRTTVEFTTGLKGHIPQLGEKILVACRNIDWAQSGLVSKMDGNNMWLSEPVEFPEGDAPGYIYLNTSVGGVSGPHTVTKGTATHCIIGTWTGITIKTVDVDGEEATKFIFGGTVAEFLPVRVLRIMPQSENEVRIVGSIVHDDVYSADSEPTPVETDDTFDLLVHIVLIYNGFTSPNYTFTLNWAGDTTKVRIELDTGSGYAILEDSYTSETYDMSTTSLSGTVKITPYDEDDVLITADALTETFEIPGIPTSFSGGYGLNDTIRFSWLEADWTKGWDYELNIVYGDAIVYVKDKRDFTHVGDSPVYLDITHEELVNAGGPWLTFTANLYAVSTDGYRSEPATDSVALDALTAPSAPELLAKFEGGGAALNWDDVEYATGYLVYIGATSDFNPVSAGTLLYDGQFSAKTLGNITLGEGYQHYFKVAPYNAFITTPASLNFSAALSMSDDSLENVQVEV